MDGHIVFEYYDGFFSSFVLYFGSFLTFCAYCICCRKAKFNLKNIIFSFFLLFIFGLTCGSFF